MWSWLCEEDDNYVSWWEGSRRRSMDFVKEKMMLLEKDWIEIWWTLWRRRHGGSWWEWAWKTLWRSRWCFSMRRTLLYEHGLGEEDDDVSWWEEHLWKSMNFLMKRKMMVFLNEKNVTVRAWTFWWRRWWILMRRMLVKEELGILKKRIMLPDEKNVSERGEYQASWGRGRLSLNEKNIACWKSICFVKKQKKKMMMMFLDE